MALVASLLFSLFSTACRAEVWTNPHDPGLPLDALFQGEYVGSTHSGEPWGAQIIALGNGHFQAVLLRGGLPGAGWDGQNKTLLAGQLDGHEVRFTTAEGNRRYLAGPPEQFSATRRFPPAGQLQAEGVLAHGVFRGEIQGGESFRLDRTIRKSPTLGTKPPPNAVVLFDGSDKDPWRGGRLDTQTGLLNTDGRDILTRQRWQDFTLHIEFMLPFRPAARGQGRGNSGVYLVDHYEVQVLDSFGLEGLHDECGGIYSKRDADLNMCLPPLQWQTYDIEFTNARMDENGNRISNARATVRFNGVVIHDKVEIDGPTGGHRNEPEGTPGPLKLQGHGNPLQFRNIWLVEKE